MRREVSVTENTTMPCGKQPKSEVTPHPLDSKTGYTVRGGHNDCDTSLFSRSQIRPLAHSAPL